MVELEVMDELTSGSDSVAQPAGVGVAEDDRVELDRIAPDKLAPFTLDFVPVVDFEAGRVVVARGALLPEEEGDARIDEA